MLKGVILGGGSATGRALVQEMAKSSKWNEISIIAQKEFPEWAPLIESNKIKFLKTDNFDNLIGQTKRLKWQFKNYNSLFNCLPPVNSREDVIKNMEKYKKQKDSDYTRAELESASLAQTEKHAKEVYIYAVDAAKFAKKEKIPHYSLIRALKRDLSLLKSEALANKWYNSQRIRQEKRYELRYEQSMQQAESDILKENLGSVAFFRPGRLLDRWKDRKWNDVLAAFVPNAFLPKVTMQTLARGMLAEAEQFHEKKNINNNNNLASEFNNQDIIALAKSNKIK